MRKGAIELPELATEIAHLFLMLGEGNNAIALSTRNKRRVKAVKRRKEVLLYALQNS